MDIVSAARILYYRNTNTQRRYTNRRTSPETPAVPRLYTRTLLRQQELEILELVFAACHYPDKVVVESLSQQLDVPTSRIQAWFIKRRAARRRKEISYIGSRSNVAIENLERPAPVVESHQRQANTNTEGQDMMIMATQGIQDPGQLSEPYSRLPMTPFYPIYSRGFPTPPTMTMVGHSAHWLHMQYPHQPQSGYNTISCSTPDIYSMERR